MAADIKKGTNSKTNELIREYRMMFEDTFKHFIFPEDAATYELNFSYTLRDLGGNRKGHNCLLAASQGQY